MSDAAGIRAVDRGEVGAVAVRRTAPMNATARRLRVQKAFSTDPAWLERMACELEAQDADPD